jgi:microcystin-dependent protein
MADPFVAEIRIVGFTFAPTGWAFCHGQLLPISQNTALFSLLGTTYGGDGKSTFALPNLAGRMPMHFGQGAGLTPRDLGEQGGRETVTLLPTEIPAHTHTLNASTVGGPSAVQSPANAVFGSSAAKPYVSGAVDGTLAAAAVGGAGAGQPHNNLPPYLAMNFIIALQGIFPPRS